MFNKYFSPALTGGKYSTKYNKKKNMFFTVDVIHCVAIQKLIYKIQS